MHCTSVRYDARLVKMVALAVIHSPLPIDPRQTLGPPLPETKAILPIIVGSGHLGQQRVKEFFFQISISRELVERNENDHDGRLHQVQSVSSLHPNNHDH